jgi:GT2 family glycosyltransferase
MPSGSVVAPDDPQIAVCVASHERPLRLRWLLNALEEQTLPRERFEVVVADDSSAPQARRALESHPLNAAGVLRHLALPPGRGSAAKLRNAAWHEARAPLIAFTDDDCRPPPEWLERLLEAGRANPGAIVQGMTLPDPAEEVTLHHGPHHVRTQEIRPPVPWAQACNILYPRDVLERLGGFLEVPPLAAGEDTELAERARAAGTEYVAAPAALTWHAVYDGLLPERLRSVWRWQDLPLLVKRHPRLRDEFVLWMFWRRRHVWLLPAAAGAFLGRRRPALWALALPWLLHALPSFGPSARGRLRGLTELPSAAVLDLAEMAALARGSVKHRSLFL